MVNEDEVDEVLPEVAVTVNELLDVNAAVGVPVIAQVLVLKLIQPGALPVSEQLESVPPDTVTVGVKLNESPTVPV